MTTATSLVLWLAAGCIGACTPNVETINADAAERKATALAWAKYEMRYPKCDETVPHGAVCGLVTSPGDEALFRRFVSMHCANLRARACRARFAGHFVGELLERYPRASSSQIHERCRVGEDCSALYEVELAYLEAHNADVIATARHVVEVAEWELQGQLAERARIEAVVAAIAAGFQGEQCVKSATAEYPFRLCRR